MNATVVIHFSSSDDEDEAVPDALVHGRRPQAIMSSSVRNLGSIAL